MTRRRRPLVLLLCATAVALPALVPAPAAAAFHLMSIREVYPGSATAPGAEYVELQMYAAGQNLVQGHSVTFYSAGGAPIGSDSFPQDVPNGENQRTVLLGTVAAESQFGVSVDAAMTPERLDPTGGAVCFESIDCISWGAFVSSLPSPAGAPAPAIPDGMALRRTIARRCPTLLEEADDSDDSAADLFDAFPFPRPNSVPPTEFACSSQTTDPGAGGAGGAAGGPSSRGPQTRIVRGPGRVTRDRTPTFHFRANQPASFLCQLNGGPARRCRSPWTTRRLRYGCHAFRVRARVGRTIDRMPAVYRFRIVKRKMPGLPQFERCRRSGQ